MASKKDHSQHVKRVALTLLNMKLSQWKKFEIQDYINKSINESDLLMANVLLKAVRKLNSRKVENKIIYYFLQQCILASKDTSFFTKLLQNKEVKTFLEQDLDFSFHKRLMCIAIGAGKDFILDYMVNHGFPKPYDERFLQSAILGNQLDMCKKLRDPNQWDCVTDWGKGCTEICFRTNNLTILNWLRPPFGSKCPWDEAMVANLAMKAHVNGNPSLIKWLIEDRSIREIHIDSFLSIAIRSGNLDYLACAIMTLQFGWKYSFHSDHLMDAIESKSHEMIQYIVEKCKVSPILNHISASLELKYDTIEYLLLHLEDLYVSDEDILLLQNQTSDPKIKKLLEIKLKTIRSPSQLTFKRKRSLSIDFELFHEKMPTPPLARRKLETIFAQESR